MSPIYATPPDKHQAKVYVRFLVTLTFTVLFLATAYRNVGGVRQLVGAANDARWGLLSVALSLTTLNLALSGARLALICQTMGYPVRYGDAARAVLASWPIAVITPSRAGDLYRAAYLQRTVPLSIGLGGVIAEKLIDMQSLLWVALVGAILANRPGWALCIAAVMASSAGVFLLLGRHELWLHRLPIGRRNIEKLGLALVAFASLLRHPRRLMVLGFLSVASFFNAVLLISVLLAFSRATIAFHEVLAAWPLAVFVGLLPVTVAGMGTRDMAFVYLLGLTPSLAGPAAQVLLACLAYSLLSAWLYALVGVPFLWSGPSHSTANR